MANLVPRDFWNFPSLRGSSFIDEIEELLPISQTDTASAVSISEDDKHIHIEAAIPGVDPDNVEVTYDKGMLWVKGEAQHEEKDKKRKFYRKAAQSFSYRIAVPGEIDPNAKLEASYKNGMVMITFPKAVSSQPQRITVKRESTNGKKNFSANQQGNNASQRKG